MFSFKTYISSEIVEFSSHAVLLQSFLLPQRLVVQVRLVQSKMLEERRVSLLMQVLVMLNLRIHRIWNRIVIAACPIGRRSNAGRGTGSSGGISRTVDSRGKDGASQTSGSWGDLNSYNLFSSATLFLPSQNQLLVILLVIHNKRSLASTCAILIELSLYWLEL